MNDLMIRKNQKDLLVISESTFSSYPPFWSHATQGLLMCRLHGDGLWKPYLLLSWILFVATLVVEYSWTEQEDN